MRQFLFIGPVLLLVVSVGCRSGTPVEAVVDGGVIEPPRLVQVSGKAEILPEAARLLTARALPAPAVGTLRVRLEDPVRANLADPDATLAELPLSSDGTFSVAQLNA